jgi:L-fuculose-phosphate aldolase
VPLAAYGLPGTPELTEPMIPLIPRYDAVLMANHGAVCYGEDAFQAYFRMETIEHFARITLVAELLGGPNLLPRREVDKLLDSRTRYGVKARAAGGPECPVVAEDMAGYLAGTANERIYVTRSELIGLVDEALRARGIA